MVSAKEMAKEVKEVHAGRGKRVEERTKSNEESTKNFCNESLSYDIRRAAENGESQYSITFGCIYPFDYVNVSEMYFKQKYWGECSGNAHNLNLPKIQQILADHGYKFKVTPIEIPYSSSEDIEGYRLDIEW